MASVEVAADELADLRAENEQLRERLQRWEELADELKADREDFDVLIEGAVIELTKCADAVQAMRQATR